MYQNLCFFCALNQQLEIHGNRHQNLRFFLCKKKKMKWTSPIQIYDYDIFLRIKKTQWDVKISYQNL